MGRVAHRYVAIVGDPEHPSPEISASYPGRQPQIRPDGADVDHQEGNHSRMQRDPGFLTRAKTGSRRFGQGDQSKSVNWTPSGPSN